MARPSQNTDQRLIKAAQEMLKHSGLSHINLRQVAAKAKVNLGMFHYHFKTKDQFTRAVLQDTYEKFFQNFNLEIEGERSPLEKLRAALLAIARFVKNNRQLIVSLLQDALNRDPVARNFAKDNFKRHVEVVMDLLAQCQRNGSLGKTHKLRALVFLMASINAVNLVVTVFEQMDPSKLMKIPLKGIEFLLLSEDAIRERVDMALRGLGAKERMAS